MGRAPAIAVLGASGLIGQSVARDLARRGFHVQAIARRFTDVQRAGLDATIAPVAALDPAALSRLFDEACADIVINCVGVLQDSARGRSADINGAFVSRLLAAVAACARPILLVHVSVPGAPADDTTDFSRSKRGAERAIAASGAPFVILRPGFVIAPNAYGGSALIRALAALPCDLPAREANRPFAATAIGDIAATIAVVAERWRAGERDWRAVWDVMERAPDTVGGVVRAFRAHFGGPRAWFAFPGWLLDLGARSGDFAARLGWAPPIRTTALVEMRRGVEGDPSAWIAVTGIEPASLQVALASTPATIQERWFGRLYLAKALVIATLALFWIASGAIALTAGFEAAADHLTSRGFPRSVANALVSLTSLLDIAIGAMIAQRRSCRAGLLTGVAAALGYLAGATLLAPELWGDPLGPLVKIAPAIVLMIVALAMLDDR